MWREPPHVKNKVVAADDDNAFQECKGQKSVALKLETKNV